MYMTDYNDYPGNNNSFYTGTNGRSTNVINKFFIVADSATGKILINRTITEDKGYHLTLIINGVNNDVFVGVGDGLVRLYV